MPAPDVGFDSVSFAHSIFLLLPRGAGSRGVRVYVTVLVTTCLTLTGRWPPLDRGDAKCLVLPSMIQSAGEKGDRIALLLEESVVGEKAGDWGIRRRCSVVGVRPEGVRLGVGRTNGVGGMTGEDEDL